MYVAVKGGEAAIEAAHRLLAEARRGDRAIAELTLAQIEQQLALAVDRVMTEGSVYDRELSALAIKQARGDLIEAIFLLRAYRTTLPRLAFSLPIETSRATVKRRISATFKELPGGQVLGSTFDYTHRLLDFSLAAEAELAGAAPADAQNGETVTPTEMPRVSALLAEEELIDPNPAAQTEPEDLTREPLSFPADRSARLQNLARGDEGFLLALGYSTQRGYGRNHPFAGEIRTGAVEVEIIPPELGFPVVIGEITVTECEMVNQFKGSASAPPQAQPARDPVDDGDGDQDQQHNKCHLVEIVGADLLGQLQADAAGSDNADNRRRSRVRLEEVQDLAGDDRQDLRQQAEPDPRPRIAAGGDDGFALALAARLDRFRKQLAQRSCIGHGNCQHAGKGTKPDDTDKDQRPNQGVDAADDIEQSPNKETDRRMGRRILGGQQAQRRRQRRADQGAEEGDRQRFDHRAQEQLQMPPRRGRHHQAEKLHQFADPRPDLREGDAEPPYRKGDRAEHGDRAANLEGAALRRLRQQRPVARQHGGRIRREQLGTPVHPVAAPLARRRRTRLVTISRIATATMISSRMALTSV
jgi:alpha-D-ribose 1-methylphosphonate 5-triphosphate synthase subunit PhnI